MMETIIDALKAMGKASSIEIAARLGMERQEVIDQLWELKEAEVVKKDGHCWELVTGNASGHVGKSEAKPVSIKAEDLINIIAEKGPMTAEELAAVAGVTARRVASSLAMATSRGKVVRKSASGKFHYMMPGTETATIPDSETKKSVPASGTKSVSPAPAPAPAPAPKMEIIWPAPPPVAASRAESDGTETLTLPTIAHLRQRIKQQKAGARRDEQLLKHLIRVHRLLEVTNG
ncbi:DUF1627 domain-containing protein [Serratia sp. PL7]|uniref:DUF1627 domain-containing protein n=1 Tax=Serratia sp. PL7 TaxID=2952201 RepID=UPI0021AD874D|nr:DUF1627 domain-containing protein [Serratia sp. PL7]